MIFSDSWRRFALFSVFAVSTGTLAGCGGGGGSSLPAPATPDDEARDLARWKPVVSGDAGSIEAPPFAGAENNEIAQLLALQNARTPAQTAIFNKWNNRAASVWNRIARDLVIANNTVPPRAARIYAALSIAQYDATIAAARGNVRRATPRQSDSKIAPLSQTSDGYPSRTAALCSASADVLKAIYPNNKTQIESAETECAQSRLTGGVSFPSDIDAGARVGDAIAAKVLARIAIPITPTKPTRTFPNPAAPASGLATKVCCPVGSSCARG